MEGIADGKAPLVQLPWQLTWDDEYEISSPDYLGPMAKTALPLLPALRPIYLEPAPDGRFLPILTPWPNPSTIVQLYVRVKSSLRIECIKMKDVFGLPMYCSGKESASRCRRHKRHGVDP